MVWWFPSTGGARRGAFPLDPMEYVFTEGTASPYDVMYDTVHAVPATPVSIAASESALATAYQGQRKLIRTSDGTLYATYFKQLAGQYQIYVKKSEDDGATWTDETRISTYANMATNHQNYPCIAVDSSDNLHVVWQGRATGYTTHRQIWYALYDGEWQDPVRLSDYAGMENEYQNDVAIAVDSSDNLHVVWSGSATGFPTHPQIWYVKYDGSWSTPLRISTKSLYRDDRPSIAVDSANNIHVVWDGYDTPATGYQINYAKYDGSWSTPIRISTAAGMALKAQWYSSLALDSDDHLHVVWIGWTTVHPTYFQTWYALYDGEWQDPVRLSTALNMANNSQGTPSIAVDSLDNIHVLWHGKATGYTTQAVVWYAVYVASWATPVCIQPTGRNMSPNLRWSRWPR